MAKTAAKPKGRVGADGELRAPLSRERVVRAAIELADRDGIEALSMRKLAEGLGVEAMSLYHHVTNKDDLLAGMVDVIMGELELPELTGRGGMGAAKWRAAIRKGAISFRGILRRHGWARSALTSPAGVRPSRLRFMDWLLRRLREGGFSAGLTYHAYHALDSHIIGSAWWAAGYAAFANNRKMEEMAERAMKELPMSELPYLQEHMQQHVEGFGRGTNQFEFGLDLILESLEKNLAEEGVNSTP